MRTRNSTALVVLLLAGCGGGGGSDDQTAVSANPPAPEPVVAAPAPSAAAPAPTPTASPIPSPGKVPEPASPPAAQPPAAQPPAANPPAAQPPATSPPIAQPPAVAPPAVVSGAMVGDALSRYYGWTGDDPTATAYGPAGRVIVSQRVAFGPPDQQPSRFTYSNQSGGDGAASFAAGTYYLDEGLHTVFNNTTGVDLYRAEPFDPRSQSWALDQSIAEWKSADGNWNQKLVLQSDGTDRFRVCWLYNLPNIDRLVCSKHNLATGDHVGVHVVDDSIGIGPQTWTTP